MFSESRAQVLLDRGLNTNCTFNLFGAAVTSWRVNNEEQLFVSKISKFDARSPIRGAVSFVFPVYGEWMFGPLHGFARITEWDILKPPTRLCNNDVEAVFSLRDNDLTRSMWNFQFHITYRLLLKEKELHFNICVRNTSELLTMRFHLLLLNYMKAPKLKVAGLQTGFTVEKCLQDADDELKLRDQTELVYRDAPDELALLSFGRKRVMNVFKWNLSDVAVWSCIKNEFEGNQALEGKNKKLLAVKFGNMGDPTVLLAGHCYEAGQILQLLC